MDVIKFHNYYGCISSIKSEEMIDLFTCHIYPNLKDADRKSLFKQVKSNIGQIISKAAAPLATYESVLSKVKGVLSGRR